MWVYTSATAGQGDSASKSVTITLPTLSIHQSDAYVYSGDTVAFSVTATGGTPDVLSWTWVADGQILANRMPGNRPSIGSRTADAGRLSDSRIAPRTGRLQTLVVSGCTAHNRSCSESITESGTLRVQAVVDGITLADSAHVRVADLANLPAPPLGVLMPEPDSETAATSRPTLCPEDTLVFRRGSVLSRMKFLSDSTAIDNHEHGSSSPRAGYSTMTLMDE